MKTMRPTLISFTSFKSFTPLTLLTGALLSASLLAVSPAHAASELLMENKVLAALVEQVMQPMANDFAKSSAALAHKSEAYCQGKAKLDELRTAWRNTQANWQPLEMMPIGPVSENRLHRQVNAWPLRVNLLEPLLKDDASASVDRVRRMGAAAKGLPAVEYLLFDAHERLSAHCGVLKALTGHISGEAQKLERAWKDPKDGYGQQLANAGRPGYTEIFADTEQAYSDLINLLIAGLDTVKTVKLGKALERSTDGPSLERIESWRSGTTLDNIANNLRGFEQVFFGQGENGLGLDDYLASIERPGLARVIGNQLNSVKRALADVRPPLQTALTDQRDAVAALLKEVTRLQYLMETEVAPALNVDLGFNANDGD